MIEKMKSFLKEDSFQMIIKEDSIYLANYKRLITLEEDCISVQTKNKKIKIIGKNLKTKKIIEKEILVEGTIHNIEVIYE